MKEKILAEIESIYYHFNQYNFYSKLIPEVRTNISGSLPSAESLEDIAGIDGRITVVDGVPKKCGEIKFGASNHTARLLLAAKKYDSAINFVMNLKYTPDLIERLKKDTNMELFEFKRDSQPFDIEKKEDSTMQWLIKESIKASGKIPDIIWDTGAIGKEPMIRLFANNYKEMINKLIDISEFI